MHDRRHEPRDTRWSARRWSWPSLDKTLAEISLELRRSEFETRQRCCPSCTSAGLLAGGPRAEEAVAAADPVGTIKDLLTVAQQRLTERRYDAALRGLRGGAGASTA